jgi:quinol monooxygenase YgiN
MIIVTGNIMAKAETLDELFVLALEHSRRSRLEPGCLAHGVHQDCENQLRLVFFEQWTDHAALAQHFKLPAARLFAKKAFALAAEPPEIEIYEAVAADIKE